MKKLFLLVAFTGALVITQSAQASVALLSGLYNSVSNQLYIVSNTPPVDTKLAKSLNSALASIQKSGGGPDVASAIKGLGSVVKIVNRTSVSNAVAGSVHGTLVSIANQYIPTAIGFSNQVAALFPSKGQTAALNAISNLLVTVASLNGNANITAALKALSGLTKQTATIQKSVTAAQKAPAPAASVTATIVISGSPNFSFQASHVVFAHTALGNFVLNAQQTSGKGTGTILHSFTFGIYGLVAGSTTTVSGSDGQYSRGGLAGSAAFAITTSSITANWDQTHKLVSGTFTFGLHEESGTRTGSVTGSFSEYYP